MTDLETRLRETFDRHADRADLAVVTRALLARARRRLARTLVGSAVVVLALAGLCLWAVRTATTEPVPPVHRPVAPDLAAHNGDLAYVGGPLDAARLVIRHRDGSASTIDRTRIEPEPCTPYPVVATTQGTPRCGGFGSLLWSPDGHRLGFVFQHRWRHPEAARAVVYVVRADGSGLRKVGVCPTHRGIMACDLSDGAGLTWSADSSRIAVSGDGRIWTASVDEGAFRELTRCPPCLDSHPAWSPDGRSIAFARDDGVYEASVSDGSTWRLAVLRGARAPAWSPDGTRIAILAEDGVYVLEGVDGSGEVRRIAEVLTPERVSVPAWSPDGLRLAWLVEVSSRAPRVGLHVDLWTTRLDGTPPVRVVQGPCCLADERTDARVTWSPDGRMIAVHAPGLTAARSPQGVLVVDVASGRLHRIPGGASASPAWRPVA